MRAIVVHRFGGPEVVEVADVPAPLPGAGHVRIRVAGSALNPIDVSTRNGALLKAGLVAPAERYGLGWDVAGVVDAVGEGVTAFAPGDAVIGLRDLLFAWPGAHAEQVVLHERAVARAPRSASLREAATLPLNGTTADRALELSEVSAGDTLLVTGAAGGVGGFVLQLAAVRGVRTIATAGHHDEALVRQLGASEFLPRGSALGAAVRTLASAGVDAVIDAACVGIGAHDALRGGGVFVALVRPFAPPPIRGTRVVVQESHADGARLSSLAEQVDAGRLTLRVAETYPLERAAEAHQRFAAGGLRGRIVLVP